MLLGAALAVAAVAITPSPALGASVTMTAPTAPVSEDLATQLTFSGDGGTGLRLYVKDRPTGGAPCSPITKDDPGAGLISSSALDPTFTKSVSETWYQPGVRQICIWLQTAYDASSAAFATSAQVTVRQPNSTFTIVPPTGLRSGRATQLTLNWQSEATRRLYVRTKPAGGTGCAPITKNDNGEGLLSGQSIFGGPSTTNVTFTPGAPGNWLLCGWVQEDYDDEEAELGTQATYTVPRISTKTGIKLRRYYGYPNGYTVTGRIVGGPGGGNATLQRYRGGRWTKWKSAAISGNGYYSVVIYPKKRTLIRVRYPGNSSYLSSTSKEISVRRFR